MERFTISLDETLAREFDALIAARGYATRSEAVRDLIRSALETERQRRQASGAEAGYCVANLSYVFNHHARELSERLTRLQHDQHDLTVAAMHSHLDHAYCLESVILRGPTVAVRRFADTLIAERGVHHGQVNLIGMTLAAADHHHGPHDAPPDPAAGLPEAATPNLVATTETASENCHAHVHYRPVF